MFIDSQRKSIKELFLHWFLSSGTRVNRVFYSSVSHFRSIESEQWNSIISNESQTCSSFAHLWKLARSQWRNEWKEMKRKRWNVMRNVLNNDNNNNKILLWIKNGFSVAPTHSIFSRLQKKQQQQRCENSGCQYTSTHTPFIYAHTNKQILPHPFSWITMIDAYGLTNPIHYGNSYSIKCVAQSQKKKWQRLAIRR